jgi:hypothetical protein
MMKTFMALLLMTTCATAEGAVDSCTGRVKMVVETTNDGLYPKGSSGLEIGDCVIESQRNEKRILRTCPIGSRCRITGIKVGDAAIDAIIGITRLK